MTAPADDLLEPGEGGDPTEPQRCQFDQDVPAVRSLLFRGGEAYTPVCDEHEDEARAQLAEAGETVSDVVDIKQGAVTAAADIPPVEAQPGPDDGEWRVRFPVMALEGLDTSDGRFLTPGTIIARACPMSILAQPFASHGGQEPPPAVVVGRLDKVERVPGPSIVSRVTNEPFPEGSFVWVGHGAVDPSIDVHGLNIGNLLKRRFLNGASVDLAGMDVEMIGEDGFEADPDNPRRQMVAHRGEQAAITLVPIPAFGDAYVELVADEEPFTPADPEEFPEGFCASAFPAWRSAEVGDYPALVAAGDDSWPAAVPAVPAAVEELAAVIADDGGQQRDAHELAAAIVDHIHHQWATGDADTQVAARPAMAAPGAEGTAGPGPADYTKPHVYARDPQSGAGNCVCGAAPSDELHVASPLAPVVAAADASPVEAGLIGADEDGSDMGMPDAPQPCADDSIAEHSATRSLLFEDGQRFAPTCDEHEQAARAEIEARGLTVEDVVEIVQSTDDPNDEETSA